MAAALMPDASQPATVSAKPRDESAARIQPAVSSPLPARWNAPMLEAAPRNPFAPDTPAAAVAAAPAIPPPKLQALQEPRPVATVAPAVAMAQPFAYRYVGRVIDPQGQRVVYVGRGDVTLTVQAGMQLADGYLVETISESTIEFINPANQQRHTIAMPADAAATASTDGNAFKQ